MSNQQHNRAKKTSAAGAVDNTVATRARAMAERINKISMDVVSSFKFSDAAQRTQQISSLGNEILLGMLPVFNWLERRRHPDTATQVKQRVDLVLNEALACAALEIPEYAGGEISRNDGTGSTGAIRTATLLVAARLVAHSLMGWADDIEAEDAARSPHSPETPAPKKQKKKPTPPPTIPSRYENAVKLWPTFAAEMEQEKKRATIERFREWLKKRPRPILVDDYFQEWWNNNYRRQLRRRKT